MAYNINLIIGGELSKDKMEEFADNLGCIYDLEEGDIISLLEDHTSGVLEIEGTLDERDDDCLINELEGIKLPFLLELYNNQDKVITCWWLPGMNNIKYHSSHVTLNVSDIQPLLNLILDFTDKGIEALPLYVTNKQVALIVAECVRDPNNVGNILRKAMESYIPLKEVNPPNIPEFKII